MEALDEKGFDGYGSDVNRAIAARLVDNMYNLFVMLAVTDFLAVSEGQRAEIRDKQVSDTGNSDLRRSVASAKHFSHRA